MAREQKINKLVGYLEEIKNSPAFRLNGLTIDIRDNNTIVVTANNIKGPFAGKISKGDSEELLNLMKIALKDTVEEPQGHIAD